LLTEPLNVSPRINNPFYIRYYPCSENFFCPLFSSPPGFSPHVLLPVFPSRSSETSDLPTVCVGAIEDRDQDYFCMVPPDSPRFKFSPSFLSETPSQKPQRHVSRALGSEMDFSCQRSTPPLSFPHYIHLFLGPFPGLACPRE